MNTENSFDEKKLNSIKLRVLEVEKENLRTRDKTNDAMVDIIRRIIKDELNKNY